MQTVKHFVLTILMAALFFAVASAQITSEPTVPPIAQAPVVAKHEKQAGDTVRVSAAYLDSRVPLTEREYDEVVNGFTAEADLRLFKLGAFRGSAAYIFQQRNNEEVYPLYFDGMRIVSLYRNVRTHYAGFQLGVTLGHAVEPFVGYFVGTNKVHEDANRQITSKVRVGVNVPFHKSSPFFIKAAIDLNRSYGSPNKMQPLPIILPATIGGFISPENRQVVIGAGFRF